jgi:hypothetical protein
MSRVLDEVEDATRRDLSSLPLDRWQLLTRGVPAALLPLAGCALIFLGHLA